MSRRPAPARRSIDTILWMGMFVVIGLASAFILEDDAGARNVGIWIAVCGFLLMGYVRYFAREDR